MIYFVQAVDGGPIKIGMTRNMVKRIRSLNGASPSPLRVLGVIDGNQVQEKTLHVRFKADRIFNEWFKPSGALLALIEAEARPWTTECDDNVHSGLLGAKEKSLATFAELSRQFSDDAAKVNPTEVQAIAYATGMRVETAGNACVVNPEDLPALTSRLRTLHSRKAADRRLANQRRLSGITDRKDLHDSRRLTA